jgi:transcriptional regulator GlxA family with amidase domain
VNLKGKKSFAMASCCVSGERLRIVLLATADAQPLDVAGPYEVFAAVNQKLGELGNHHPRGYDVEVLKIGKGRLVTSASGFSLLSDGSYHRLKGQVDTLLVAGGMEPWDALRNEALLTWLRDWAPRVRRLGSVRTGVFVLAAAGLLKGRRATTHWHFCEQLANRYPEIELDPNPIFIRDGHVYTSAGATSGIDLALSLVEEDFGAEVALRIAREHVMFLRRAGSQSQLSMPLSFTTSSESRLNKLQAWIFEHLHESLSLERLASQVNMSPRNFARMFVRELGLTPGRYLSKVRVEGARKRLEETNQGIEQIAAEMGFGTGETMRRTFLRILKVSPNDYRSRSSGEKSALR